MITTREWPQTVKAVDDFLCNQGNSEPGVLPGAQTGNHPGLFMQAGTSTRVSDHQGRSAVLGPVWFATRALPTNANYLWARPHVFFDDFETASALLPMLP